MKDALLIELAETWELQAATGGDGLNRLQPAACETLRACADALRMLADMSTRADANEPRVAAYWQQRAMKAEAALARGMEARSGETEGLDPKGDSPVPSGTRPEALSEISRRALTAEARVRELEEAAVQPEPVAWAPATAVHRSGDADPLLVVRWGKRGPGDGDYTIPLYIAAAAVQPPVVPPWPKTNYVGRIGDMAPAERTHMRVILDGDNDVIVDVWQHDEGKEFGHSASIEFCNGGGGGGGSPRTRAALVALMVAMEADNADRATARKAFPPVRGIGSVPPSPNTDSVHQSSRLVGGAATEPGDAS